MTRQEFYDEMCDMDDLYRFCMDHSLEEYFEDYYDEDRLDEYVSDMVRDRIEHDSWTEVRDYLNDIPTGWDWYRYSDWDGTFSGVDDDTFSGLLQDIADAYEDMFDEEELEIVEEFKEESCVPDEEADEICFDDFLASNDVTLATIAQLKKREEL